MKKVSEILKTLLCLPLAAAFCLSEVASAKLEWFRSSPDSTFSTARKVPAIVVGQALEKCHPAAPPEYSGDLLCDMRFSTGWRNCVLWVRSGSHYKFEVNPDMPAPDILVNLMLSRGDHTGDAQMIDAIYHPESRGGWAPVINRLRPEYCPVFVSKLWV